MDAPAEALLSRLQLLAGLDLPDGAAVMSEGRTLQRRRGQDLFSQGEPAPELFYLHQGLVRLGYLGADGTAQTKSIVTEGAVFGSLRALLGGEAAAFSATALEPCVAVALPYRAIAAAADRNPAWDRVGRRLLEGLGLLKEEREYELLALTPAERWLKLQARRPELLGRVSQAELARLIGITPVALSRIKRRLSTRPRTPRG